MKKSEYALFGGLTAVSGLVAATGEPVGFAGLALFGGGGAAYWALNRPPRETAVRWPYHGTVPAARRDTGDTAGLVFQVSRTVTVVAALGAASFVVACVLSFVAAWRMEPGARWAGSWSRESVLVASVVGMVVFGVFLLAALPGAVRPLRLALLPAGVHCRTSTGSGWLPWEALGQVRVARRFGNPQLRLRARSPEQARLSGVDRWLRSWRRRRLGADLAGVVRGRSNHVATGALATTARQAVVWYRDHPAVRPELADPVSVHQWTGPE